MNKDVYINLHFTNLLIYFYDFCCFLCVIRCMSRQQVYELLIESLNTVCESSTDWHKMFVNHNVVQCRGM